MTPVPPFATASVPATETAPDVAVDGVSPVEPKLIVVTPPDAGVDHEGTPEANVNTCPLVPAASFDNVLDADA